METWVVVAALAAAALLGVAGVAAAHRRRIAQLSPMEQARRATRELARDRRALRGRRSRGTGDHFGKTKIKKYGDEHRADDRGGGGSDSDSGGGSSW